MSRHRDKHPGRSSACPGGRNIDHYRNPCIDNLFYDVTHGSIEAAGRVYLDDTGSGVYVLRLLDTRELGSEMRVDGQPFHRHDTAHAQPSRLGEQLVARAQRVVGDLDLVAGRGAQVAGGPAVEEDLVLGEWRCGGAVDEDEILRDARGAWRSIREQVTAA